MSPDDQGLCVPACEISCILIIHYWQPVAFVGDDFGSHLSESAIGFGSQGQVVTLWAMSSWRSFFFSVPFCPRHAAMVPSICNGSDWPYHHII